MNGHRYRFRSVWEVPVEPAEAFRVLRELADYPAWWRQVRTAEAVDDDTFRLRVRSLLPYDLVITATRAREDPGAGVLEATLSGDLTGYSRWVLSGSGTGARAVFEEDVVAEKPLLRRLGAVARPAFRANHAVMMRAGERGLRAYVGGCDAGGPTRGGGP